GRVAGRGDLYAPRRSALLLLGGDALSRDGRWPPPSPRRGDGLHLCRTAAVRGARSGQTAGRAAVGAPTDIGDGGMDTNLIATNAGDRGWAAEVRVFQSGNAPADPDGITALETGIQ